MKVRLAKKIMKNQEYFFNESIPPEHIKKYNIYWLIRVRYYPDTEMKYPFDKADHRITKAISLTSKKKKYE